MVDQLESSNGVRRTPTITDIIGSVEWKMILRGKYYWLEWIFIVAFLDLLLTWTYLMDFHVQTIYHAHIVQSLDVIDVARSMRIS
jgi:hypothetical protein